MRRLGHWIGALCIAVVAVICAAWAFGALWFDAPTANRILAIAFLIGCVAVLGSVRPLGRKVTLVAILFGAVLMWWLTLKPTNEANWQPDVAQLAWAEINGNEVTLHNVRNSRLTDSLIRPAPIPSILTFDTFFMSPFIDAFPTPAVHR